MSESRTWTLRHDNPANRSMVFGGIEAALRGLDLSKSWDVTIEEHEDSRTLQQLRYYYGVVCKIIGNDDSVALKVPQCDIKLRHECMAVEHFEHEGVVYPFYPSLSTIGIKKMARYIDDCCDWAGVRGIYVPPPEWRK
jgi:hypothetical protein